MSRKGLRQLHWRSLVKIIGWANQNMGGQKVVKNDKCMGVSQLLGGHVPMGNSTLAIEVTDLISNISVLPSNPHSFIHSFIHSGHFYSAPSSPLLLRGAPDYSTDTVSEFHAEAHRQLQVKDLPKVPTWRLEWESN